MGVDVTNGDDKHDTIDDDDDDLTHNETASNDRAIDARASYTVVVVVMRFI